MTGDLARAITLTTYGNAFLRDNYDISVLTLEHPSFTFTKKVEFHVFKKHFFRKPTWHLYAKNPVDWLNQLKEDGCTALRLVFEFDDPIHLNGEPVPNHKLAGFVGGGGNRFIEAVFPGHSDFWQSKDEVTDQDAPDNKIWTVTYGRVRTGQPTQPQKIYDIESIRERLQSKLAEISAFAKKEHLDYWAEWFDNALLVLDSPTPFAQEQDKLIIPADKMNSKTVQLLAAAGNAWCFGGMGSWNDNSFNDKATQATYDKLTAELYDIVNESYLAVGNTNPGLGVERLRG